MNNVSMYLSHSPKCLFPSLLHSIFFNLNVTSDSSQRNLSADSIKIDPTIKMPNIYLCM